MHQKVVCVCVFWIMMGREIVAYKTKYFKYDTNVLNPNNWDKGVQNCSGLWFDEENDASVYLEGLSVDQIILPRRGAATLLIGGDVVFKKTGKCTKLKPMLYRDWDDYTNWRSDGNAAVPHLQRIPCQDDIAVLTSPQFLRISTTRTVILLRAWRPIYSHASINFWPTTTLLNPLTNQPVKTVAFPPDLCSLNPLVCKCHVYQPPSCPELPPAQPPCLRPIRPDDFCTDICGAFLTFKPLDGFQLDELEPKLAEYASDTHASLVTNSDANDIQVVFAEKHFQGRSLTDAQDFFAKLESGEFKVTAVKLTKSGEYYNEADKAGGGFTLVLGTFVGVVLVFAVIFYLHDKNLEQFAVVSVLYRFSSSARTGFRDGFFARFDNIDENLIIAENQSVAGSVLHLEKSFDNPMYQESTSSGGGNQHENPLFNVALNEE